MSFNFSRQIKVICYDESNEAYYTIIGNGSSTGARMVFTSEITRGEKIPPAELKIYNISKETQVKISKSRKIEIYANYKNEKETLLFTGTVVVSQRTKNVDIECVFKIVGNIQSPQREISIGGNNISFAKGHTLRERILKLQEIINTEFVNELSFDDGYINEFTVDELDKKMNTALTLPNNIKFSYLLDRFFINTPATFTIENNILFLSRKDFEILRSEEYYELTYGVGGNIISTDQTIDEIRKPTLDNYYQRKNIKNSNNEAVVSVAGIDLGSNKKKKTHQDRIPTIPIKTIYNANGGLVLNQLYKITNLEERVVINSQYKGYFDTLKNLNGFYKAQFISYYLDTHGTADDWYVNLKLVNTY